MGKIVLTLVVVAAIVAFALVGEALPECDSPSYGRQEILRETG